MSGTFSGRLRRVLRESLEASATAREIRKEYAENPSLWITEVLGITPEMIAEGRVVVPSADDPEPKGAHTRTFRPEILWFMDETPPLTPEMYEALMAMPGRRRDGVYFHASGTPM